MHIRRVYCVLRYKRLYINVVVILNHTFTHNYNQNSLLCQRGKKKMKEYTKTGFKVSILLFIVFFGIFLSYLLETHFQLNPSVIIFWIPAIGLPSIVLIQVLKFKTNSPNRIILFEIFLYQVSLCLIFILPLSTGLRGYDSHSGYFTTQSIMQYGWRPYRKIFPLLLTL